MRILGLFFLLIMSLSPKLFGQREGNSSRTKDTVIYKTTEVDSLPIFSYPKGDLQKDKIRAYIIDNQLWSTQDDGIFTIYLRFCVEKDGKTSNISVVKGIHPEYDKEAIRLIKNMPMWKPGIKNNRIVRTEMTIPIKWSIFDE